MRQSFNNPRFHRAMMLVTGVIAVGFLVAAVFIFVSNSPAGGFFLLAMGLLFAFWSWYVSPRRLSGIPADRFQRRRDRLNALFSFLRITSAVDPEWKDRQRRAGK
jgi:hypothetical protein